MEIKSNRRILIYQQAIAANPTKISNYWQLGLALLLDGQEAEAQLTWMSTLLDADSEQEQEWLGELLQILQEEAQQQEARCQDQTAWLIRQHIQQIFPENLDNLLRIVQLAIATETLTNDEPALSQVIKILHEANLTINSDLLLTVLQQVLNFDPYPSVVIELAEACRLYHTDQQNLLKILLERARKFEQTCRPDLALPLGKICLQISPNNAYVLECMITFLQDLGKSLESIPLAKQRLQQAQHIAEKIVITHSMLRGLMQAGGEWENTNNVHENYKNLLLDFVQVKNKTPLDYLTRIILAGGFFPYLKDQPAINRPIRNQFARVCQDNLRNYFPEQVSRYQQHSLAVTRVNSPVLKIGYLSECFRQHSVGWLVRWIFKYHNSNRFEIHAYSLRHTGDVLQQRFASEYCTNFHELSGSVEESADQIYQDGINVLVDLDSLTSNYACTILALKPAPIQVTWLGFDASGLPAIDYFFADPYVLPDSAQDYYTEKIWRLPQSYICVDGFEVGIPTLHREQLDIPREAIIYFSSQTGYKRHPHNIQLQMQILKEVPNSYFLIKGLDTDLESVKNLFAQIAADVGVSFAQLRFLSRTESSLTHRANLAIADVVLDTYPYNGATTTLETLWMGVPLVTRVGEQFASRNSYTMLMNVGVTAGIAWTDAEYVDWGIRLGKDAQLRQQISWKLRESRQTAPLWNAKQFTYELEQAYEQMVMLKS